MKPVLVTGAAGFIGASTAQQLLKSGFSVVGADNFHDYYDPRLKKLRLRQLSAYKNFKFYRTDITSGPALEKIFKSDKPSALIHLAALAGVRSSILYPEKYIVTNGLGALNALECCRRFGVKKIVIASTSSLYAGERMPFKESLPVNAPISPYAASKKTAEALGHVYHHLYGIDVAILRYFTVYGPAGRPDMSPFKFINAIHTGKVIEVFGDGSQKRDFTYIDDISGGTIAALRLKGFQVLNLGGNKPYTLTQFIRLIEKYTGQKAKIRYSKWQGSDMRDTWADISLAKKLLGWQPKVDLEEGVRRTVAWHLGHEKFTRKLKA